MPTRASLCVLLLSSLAAAGCGAASGLGSSDGATSTTGAGGSTGSAAGVTTAGSGGATTGGPWTFTSCVRSIQGNAGTYPGAMSIAQGATLTVTQQGSTLAVTYMDEYGANDAVTFTQTTGTSAALAPGGAVIDSDVSGMCVFGPGDTESFPAQLNATAGTLDYTSGAVFLTLTGMLGPSGSPPCSTSPIPASMWIGCGEGTGWPPAPPGSVAPSLHIPAGTYACGSVIGTYDVGDGYTFNASEAGSGTLDVTQNGSTMTAAYTGDTFLAGTLGFTAASSTSAYAGPGQALTTDCAAPYDPNAPPPPDINMAEPLPVAASSLVMDGTTLFLMFRGTMTNTICPGALKTGAVACSMQ